MSEEAKNESMDIDISSQSVLKLIAAFPGSIEPKKLKDAILDLVAKTQQQQASERADLINYYAFDYHAKFTDTSVVEEIWDHDSQFWTQLQASSYFLRKSDSAHEDAIEKIEEALKCQASALTEAGFAEVVDCGND